MKTDPTRKRADVTVIIPLFNKICTVERSLRSVMNQTLPASRVIIVDDGSTDGSANLVDRIALEDSNIKVIRSERNGGPARARNMGAAAATTEWLAFLDADDHWDERFLMRMMEGVAQTDADFASCGRTEINTRGSHKTYKFLLEGVPCGSAVELTQEFWKVALRFMPINSSANVIRRSLFSEVGGFDEEGRRWEDFILWTKLWLAGRFAFVNEPLSWYYKERGTLSAGAFPYRDALRVQVCLLKALMRCPRSRNEGARHLLLYTLRFWTLAPLSWARRKLRRTSGLSDASIKSR